MATTHSFLMVLKLLMVVLGFSSIVFQKREDLKFNSPGNFESTFIEFIFPKRKNMILGCIYRHPTSTMPVHLFNNDYILPLLEKISTEDKVCLLMGDFNIDLSKNAFNEDVNTFYNSLLSHFFAPCILQPTHIKMVEPGKIRHTPSNRSCICFIIMPRFSLNHWRERYSDIYFTMGDLVVKLKKHEFHYLE